MTAGSLPRPFGREEVRRDRVPAAVRGPASRKAIRRPEPRPHPQRAAHVSAGAARGARSPDRGARRSARPFGLRQTATGHFSVLQHDRHCHGLPGGQICGDGRQEGLRRVFEEELPRVRMIARDTLSFLARPGNWHEHLVRCFGQIARRS